MSDQSPPRVGGPHDEARHEVVVGKFLVAMVRLDNRVELVLTAHLDIATKHRAFFDECFLEALGMRRKIEALARVLGDRGLSDEFGWLIPELREVNTWRNYLAHETPIHSFIVTMGDDHTPRDVTVDREFVHFLRSRGGKKTNVAIPIAEAWARLNKIGQGLLDVWGRLRIPTGVDDGPLGEHGSRQASVLSRPVSPFTPRRTSVRRVPGFRRLQAP